MGNQPSSPPPSSSRAANAGGSPKPPAPSSRSPSPPPPAPAPSRSPSPPPPALALLPPAISITVSHDSERSLSVTPPLPTAGVASPPSSLRGSPVPPSPRSAASRASTVTSLGEREKHSYFWGRLKDQYQERKTARRQSQLGTAGKLGRPCHLAIQSISLKGAIPPEAHVHVEVKLLAGELEQNLLSPVLLPPLATPPRPPIAAGDIDLHGRVDHVLLPSVTATSTLLLSVFLNDGPAPLATLRYPLADVTATLRPTELRLTPATHGEEGATGTPPRARSPSGFRSPFSSSSVRRRSESPKPGAAAAAPATPVVASGTSPPPPPPPPTGAGTGGDQQGAAAATPMPTLGAVWGELSFFDNRTSGVGWVEVMEELGKPMRQRRLLLVTPQTFALLDGPACSLGFTGYPLIHVSHVEPARLLLSRLQDGDEEDVVAPPTHGGNGGNDSGAGFVTITLSRAEVKVAPGSGHDIVLRVGGGQEEARRWAQILKRAAHEASYGGDDG